MLLSTGIITPELISNDRLGEDFDYRARFQTFEGEQINLADYKGKTVLINLWASWCGPCRAEMPHLSELYKSLSDRKDIEFLMIGLDNDFQKSKDFIEGKSWSFPTMHASYGLSSSMRHESIPTTLVVSPKGEIVFFQEGMSNFNTAEFKDFIRNVGK